MTNMKYAAVINEIRQRITEGELSAGSKLPSIRALSEALMCSKNTIIKAYQEMENKHWIYSVPKSGYYVVSGVNHNKKESHAIDFKSAGPDKQALPYRDFQHCMNQAIELYKDKMFTYSEIQGLHTLRVQLTRYLQDNQVFTVPENIFVVSGSQQALNLLVSLPFPNGKRNICLEQPTHASFIESVKLHHATAYGIEVTSNGIDLERLEEIFKNHHIKFFYTVSRFHNPTGHSYTNTAKKKIVELAQKYDVYIIEDDYMGDFDLNLKQDPMFAYDTSGRVIYTKSFSKVLLPGLRIGMAVIPDALKEMFLRAKFTTDLHTSVLIQGGLEIYLKSGMFYSHIHKMRKIYHQKGLLLQHAYEKHLPDSVSFSTSLSGFYSTITLPNQLKSKLLAEHLKKENVYVEDAQKMYLPAFEKETVVRLSISQVDEESIGLGVQKISTSIEGLLKRRGQNHLRFI